MSNSPIITVVQTVPDSGYFWTNFNLKEGLGNPENQPLGERHPGGSEQEPEVRDRAVGGGEEAADGHALHARPHLRQEVQGDDGGLTEYG